MQLSSTTPTRMFMIADLVAGDDFSNCIEYDEDGRESPCKPKFLYRSGRSINANRIGNEITFNEGVFDKLNEDEFALLSGHEIAHYYLGHVGNSKSNEIQADLLGAKLACKAGFNANRGASIYRFVHADASHPPASERIAAVRSIECPSRMGGT